MYIYVYTTIIIKLFNCEKFNNLIKVQSNAPTNYRRIFSTVYFFQETSCNLRDIQIEKKKVEKRCKRLSARRPNSGVR